MNKGLSESKRSIHSTRIDVIAGDPLPIKAVEALPINAVARPNVEDVEYMPDTVPELAAALSALARLVPPGEVSSLYIAVRDLISRIASIDTSSLDLLQEGDARYMTPDMERDVETVLTSLRRQMIFLSQQDPEKFERRRAVLANFSATLNRALARIGSASTSKKEREKIIRQVGDLVLKYNQILRAQERQEERTEGGTALTQDVRRKLEFADKTSYIDDVNLKQVEKAYDSRVVELTATGDSFDMSVAKSTSHRRADVLTYMRASPGQTIALGTMRPNADFTLKMKARPTFAQLAEFITNPLNFAGFEMDILPRATNESGEIQAGGGFDIEMRPLYAPGSLRTVMATSPVRYNIEGREIDSVGHVHVFRRFVQKFDGREVEIRPDVFIDVAEIGRDFVLAASHDLQEQGVRNATQMAQSFFDANREHIVREALTDEGVSVTSELPKSRAQRKIMGEKSPISKAQKFALQIAREKIDDVLRDDRRQIGLDSLGQDSPADALSTRDRVVAQQLTQHQEALVFEFRDSIRRVIELSMAGLTESGLATSMPNLSDPSAAGTSDSRREERLRMSALHGTIARSFANFSEAVDESFDVISRYELEKLRSRKIKVTDRPIINPRVIEEARSSIDSLADRARRITLDNSQILEIADQLIEVADKGIESSAGFRDDIGELAQRDQNAANAIRANIERLGSLARKLSLRVKKKEVTSVDLVDFAASIAQIVPNSVDIATLTAELRASAGLGDAAQSVASAIEESNKNISYARVRPMLRRTEEIATDSVEAVTPYVLSVRKIIKEMGGTQQSLIGARGDGVAFKRFGVSTTSQVAPVFIDSSSISVLSDADDLRSVGADVVANETADALYNMRPGTAKKLTRHAEMNPLQSIDDIYNVAQSIAGSVKDAVEGCFVEGATSLQVLRGITLLACLMDERKGAGPSGEFADLLAEMLSAGVRGTSVDLASLRLGSHVRYSIGVDPTEPGVGFFADSSQRPASRVLGRLVSSETTETDEAIAGYSFLDKTLATAFVDARDVIRTALAEIFSKQYKSHREMQEAVDSEINRQLIIQMQRAASSVNNSIISPTAANHDVLDAIKRGDVNAFKQEQEKILTDPDSTPMMCATAKAAINFVEFNNRVPQSRVPYYTPVKIDADVDEETGQPLLKSSQDFVRRTLLLSDSMPALPMYKGQMSSSERDKFLRDVRNMVDQHILTDVIDTQGKSIRKFTFTGSEKSQQFLSNLAVSQMTNALSYTGTQRMPSLIAGQQVLTMVPIFRMGVSAQAAEAALVDSTDFLVRMMIKAGEEGGYITSDFADKIKGKKVDASIVTQALRDPSSSLKAPAQAIIDDITEYIAEQSERYGVIATEFDEDGKLKYSTLGDVRDAETRRAAEAVVARIAREHYESIGLKSPIRLAYSPETGHPMFPPTPTDFFRKQGLSTRLMVSDPYTFIVRSVRVGQEYRDMLRSEYGLDTQDAGHKNQLIREFEELFPGSLEGAQNAAAEKGTVKKEASLREVETLLSEMPNKVELDALTNRFIGVQGGSVKQQAENLLGAAYNLQTDIIRVFGAPFFERRLNEERDELARVSSSITTMRNILGKMTDKTADFPTSYLGDFNRCIEILRGVLTRALIDSASAQLLMAQEDIDIFLAQRVSEEIDKITTMETKKDFSVYTPTRMSAVKAKMQSLLAALLPEKDREKLERYRNFMKTGKVTARASMADTSGTGHVLIQLSDEWRTIKQNMIDARAAAQKMTSSLTARIDKQIQVMARRGAKVAESITGSKFAVEPVILDSVDQLENYRDEILKKRMIQLREAGVSEKNVEAAAQSYLNSALRGVIFGVRMSRS